jgi:hypothetical protein
VCRRDAETDWFDLPRRLAFSNTFLVIAWFDDYAAKAVTIKGRATVRSGFALLQVAEIRKF